MSALTPNLFDRRFQDLLEIGLARLPSLAPDWTDYNAHDPGITLMELLAWVAEAQLYALAHLRRDERAAYAALLGFAPVGTQGARGILWSDRLDPSSPVRTHSKTMVLSNMPPNETVIQVLGDDSPTFRPSAKLLWVPGVIERLATRQSNGSTVDHTLANERGNVAFMPFGERAGRRDVLSIDFRCRDEAGLFGANREATKDAHLAIGVRAAPPSGGAAGTGEPAHTYGSPLAAKLVTNDERTNVTVVSDTSQGMLTTGVILLALENVKSSPGQFTLELRAPVGSPRPPRLLGIELNVIPIVQGRIVEREIQTAPGTPDFSFTLEVPGLSFAAGHEPLRVEVAEAAGLAEWKRCESLSEAGPDDNVYEFDPASGLVSFGNGINGRFPPQAAQVMVSYAVSDADAGEVARNRKWKVVGFEGAFGVNLDAIAGSAPPPDAVEQRRHARKRSRIEHALVTVADVEEAARKLPLLQIARAWVAAPPQNAPRAGVLTLVALRTRPTDTEPTEISETTLWLETIRRSLAARIPLGTQLAVVAPRYRDFSIRATLEAVPGRDPNEVKEAVMKELRKRFSLDGRAEGATPRQPGVPLTSRDLKSWLRAVDGVKRIVELQLLNGRGKPEDKLAVPRDGLVRWNSSGERIVVIRSSPGSAS